MKFEPCHDYSFFITCIWEFFIADVNECARNESNDCDKNANCINTVGSYRCVCKNGFTGDGKNCTGTKSS